MSPTPDTEGRIKQSVWLGIVVGWLSQLGLKVVLPTVFLVGLRGLSLATGAQALWLEHPGDSSHPGWYGLQAVIIAGSAIAGALAALLAPRGALAVPAALLVLSLLSTSLEQLPRPLSAAVAWIWAGGPCIGLLAGWLLVQIRLRRG